MSSGSRRIAAVALLSPVLLLVVWAVAPRWLCTLALLVHAMTLVAAGETTGLPRGAVTCGCAGPVAG